jgi:hypothetical protein
VETQWLAEAEAAEQGRVEVVFILFITRFKVQLAQTFFVLLAMQAVQGARALVVIMGERGVRAETGAELFL